MKWNNFRGAGGGVLKISWSKNKVHPNAHHVSTFVNMFAEEGDH